MKQLRECPMQVLGNPLKSLIFFLSKKSMLCFHKLFINPHLVMVLILGLGIFVFTISSFTAILNLKMWSFENLVLGQFSYQFAPKILSRRFKKQAHPCNQMFCRLTTTYY